MKGQKEEEMYERKSIRDGIEKDKKGQDERKSGERRRLLLKGMSSLPPRAEIHALFEQHKGNSRKGDVKSERGRE